MAAAAESLPARVIARTFVRGNVLGIEPDDPILCEDYGVCEAAVSAALVDLTYEGPQGDESWPVAVIRRRDGEPMVAPVAFMP